ncbi:SMI1/KNR4 family protein [Kribbella shirazensis]|uniref:Knr4/Smi1-like domain-containing protein n=1 Tax=Kribbella shirazensis TaxID=1105143 RepID=A0A7X5VJE5_9ACTN|nr:SMI1/KNR4 family protein [Kribbella shirazensis]NIK62308.1 hypothetical protein [Kribbella shirazensis]
MNEDFFEPDDFYTGPRVTDALVAAAEQSLGVKLPSSYLELIRLRNGGVPRRRCFATPFATSWAHDHIEITAILGIGGHLGIDSNDGHGSRDLVREWDYPDVGLVICDTPSGGHDTVMLDYSEHGHAAEPRVVYVDEDRVPRELAPTFADFVANLAACSEDR